MTNQTVAWRDGVECYVVRQGGKICTQAGFSLMVRGRVAARTVMLHHISATALYGGRATPLEIYPVYPATATAARELIPVNRPVFLCHEDQFVYHGDNLFYFSAAEASVRVRKALEQAIVQRYMSLDDFGPVYATTPEPLGYLPYRTPDAPPPGLVAKLYRTGVYIQLAPPATITSDALTPAQDWSIPFVYTDELSGTEYPATARMHGDRCIATVVVATPQGNLLLTLSVDAYAERNSATRSTDYKVMGYTLIGVEHTQAQTALSVPREPSEPQPPRGRRIHIRR